MLAYELAGYLPTDKQRVASKTRRGAIGGIAQPPVRTPRSARRTVGRVRPSAARCGRRGQPPVGQCHLHSQQGPFPARQSSLRDLCEPLSGGGDRLPIVRVPRPSGRRSLPIHKHAARPSGPHPGAASGAIALLQPAPGGRHSLLRLQAGRLRRGGTPHRFLASLAFYDGDWRFWHSLGDGKFVEGKATPAEAAYFGVMPEFATDLSFAFLTFLAQHANFAGNLRQFAALEDDVFNLSASLAKLRLIARSESVEHGASRMAATEVEYMLLVCRSMFDLMQELAARLWDTVTLTDSTIRRHRRLGHRRLCPCDAARRRRLWPLVVRRGGQSDPRRAPREGADRSDYERRERRPSALGWSGR